jgi:hypothetical protein
LSPKIRGGRIAVAGSVELPLPLAPGFSRVRTNAVGQNGCNRFACLSGAGNPLNPNSEVE